MRGLPLLRELFAARTMDRRNFFKLVGTASGGVITGACGNQGRQIIPLLVPEEEIVPGIEEWHPSVCRECSAGCGTIVRVMESEREIELEGEKVRERIAAIKKVEGNPLDTVSGGRLCARGQAAVQALYHPDRLHGPQKDSGVKGQPDFTAVSWDDALGEAADLLRRAVQNNPGGVVYLSRPEAGSRAVVIDRFLKALGARSASTTGLCDFTIERKASELVYGWSGLPVYEIQEATCVLGLGADFLGGWVSPVFYSRRFGHMQQGRPGLRGKLVQAESRLSQTGWGADEWLPVAPGGEHALALAIGHLLLREGWARSAQAVPVAVREVFESLDFDQAALIAGIEPRRIRRVAQELAESSAPLVVPGASIVRANSLDAVVAGSALNILLGNVGQQGGVLAPATLPEFQTSLPKFQDLNERLAGAELVLLDGVNPVYTSPSCAELLTKAKAVISFSPFLDDSSVYADLLLPDHAPLESSAVISPLAATGPSLTGAPAFVRPLYETRSSEDVLVDLAARVEKPIQGYTAADAFRTVFESQQLSSEWQGGAEFADYCERQGGWWPEREPANAKPLLERISGLTEPEVEGEPNEYPFYFQPYPSLQFGEGSGANLPWLQQMPDPASSAMWNLPVEIDPRTAAGLGVSNGDFVLVFSPHGSLEAPVYVHPAAIPGVVGMAIGQGHVHYGRYASGRGANPLSIVAAAREKTTGVPAFGSTRVRLEKVSGKRGLAQFSKVDRDIPPQRS